MVDSVSSFGFYWPLGKDKRGQLCYIPVISLPRQRITWFWISGQHSGQESSAHWVHCAPSCPGISPARGSSGCQPRMLHPLRSPGKKNCLGRLCIIHTCVPVLSRSAFLRPAICQWPAGRTRHPPGRPGVGCPVCAKAEPNCRKIRKACGDGAWHACPDVRILWSISFSRMLRGKETQTVWKMGTVKGQARVNTDSVIFNSFWWAGKACVERMLYLSGPFFTFGSYVARAWKHSEIHMICRKYSIIDIIKQNS